MMSLFNSFDMFFTPMLWMISFFIVLLIGSKIFKTNFMSFLEIVIFKELEKFFLSLKMKSYNKGMVTIFLTLFLFLFVLNFSSVLSFNFALTSQVSVVLFLGLTSWLSFIMFFNFNCWKGFISHCIPEGTPMYLIWFLFIIELISNSIRPITVTVRLVANILAGHLLMILLSQLVFQLNLCFLFYLVLNLVEIFVSLIQAYIFSTMLTLYYADVN
uniref:ATP synthase subunit a n=1 Tax=Rhinotergum shaoguanense TaxID=1452699 RepID=A0A1S5XVX1_9ACAR|nr:ATP synthase F0 subunit 6 [Rhinotergum shaoguanense]AQQ72849.1 ATP synthase subunit 6 [Rhinotergum shaoguanense]